MLTSLKNIFENLILIALPSLLSLFLWLYSIYMSFEVYLKYYKEPPTPYPILLGLTGFIIWFLFCFKTVEKRFVFNNSSYPFCYSLIPVAFILSSLTITNSIRSFPDTNSIGNIIILSALILFLIDIALEIKYTLKKSN